MPTSHREESCSDFILSRDCKKYVLKTSLICSARCLRVGRKVVWAEGDHKGLYVVRVTGGGGKDPGEYADKTK